MCITSTYAHDDVIDDGRTKSVCSLLRVSVTLTFLATSDNEVNNYDERICMRDVQERVRRAIRVRTMPISMCVDVCVEVLAVRVRVRAWSIDFDLLFFHTYRTFTTLCKFHGRDELGQRRRGRSARRLPLHNPDRRALARHAMRRMYVARSDILQTHVFVVHYKYKQHRQ